MNTLNAISFFDMFLSFKLDFKTEFSSDLKEISLSESSIKEGLFKIYLKKAMSFALPYLK